MDCNQSKSCKAGEDEESMVLSTEHQGLAVPCESVCYEVVASRASLEEWLALDGGLCEVYAACFGEPPECQRWDRQDVQRVMTEFFETGCVILAYTCGAIEASARCIGFVAAVPFRGISSIGKEAIDNATGAMLRLDEAYFSTLGIDVPIAWYVADLGVSADFRRGGIGTRLLELACTAAPAETPQILLQVSRTKDFAIQLYQRAGFTLLDSFRREVPFKSLMSGDPVLITKQLMCKQV